MDATREEVIELRDVVINSVMTSQLKVQVSEWVASRGDFWVIGGFHGSGKTNLINTLAGLQSPASGVVRVLGNQIENLHGDELIDHRRKIGVVFENGGRLFNRLSVLENLALPVQYHTDLDFEAIISRVAEVMTWTGLEEYGSRKPEMLNHSWQQRVALARALMLEPEILLLDRPFSAVELRHRKWWYEFLCKMSGGQVYKSGTRVTLVITTDDIYPWLDWGTHFGVLKENQLMIVGHADHFREQQEWREMWSSVTAD